MPKLHHFLTEVSEYLMKSLKKMLIEMVELNIAGATLPNLRISPFSMNIEIPSHHIRWLHDNNKKD